MNCCFRLRSSSSSSSAAAAAAAARPPPAAAADSPSSTDLPTPPSTAHRSSTQSPNTINLTNLEYSRAVQTHSYTEIWSKIHHPTTNGDNEEEDTAVSSTHLSISSVLQPDRASIQEALGDIPSSNLTRLVSDYFDASEHTSHVCLHLHLAIDRARSLYAPLHLVLDLIPATATNPLSSAQCEWAFDKLLAFDVSPNPFPPPDAASSFDATRRCFNELRQQLDHRLRRAKKRIGLRRSAARASALCLILSAVSVAVVGLVIATHALVALVAGPPAFLAFLRRPTGLLAYNRGRIEEDVLRLEAAAKGTFVLNNDLDTIERLVSRLQATVESDRALVRLGILRGRGETHPMEEVVRQLRKNQPSLENQLKDLEEHICLYFVAVNRARSLLLQHIHHQHR